MIQSNIGKNLTLALTNVGDLLLRQIISMGVDGKPITGPIRLRVPDYQRPYKWTAKNAIQLLDDIQDAKNENKEVYRVGTLILYKKAEDNGDNYVYEIVDGQQRIITFSLLLRALREDNIDFLKQNLFENEFNRGNIPNNFRAFERRIEAIEGHNDKQDGEWALKELKNYIEDRCELIVVITSDISEAFQFFDSQNARGKKLFVHDLLKAYHLREMQDVSEEETEKIVRAWEETDQLKLSSLFEDYLYRIKEWIRGNYASELNEQNIYKFKGITNQSNSPYAQFYKSAFAYAEMVNNSAMPFVSGTRKVNAFQLDSPIVAGKPFFEYAKHYFDILADIQNNNKFEGYFVNDNEIVRTLELPENNRRVGDRITRLLFDTSLLLYVDRFCPERPDKEDLDMFEQFIVYAFIWAYSLRAQYHYLGWLSAQNYILGNNLINSMNLYKQIAEVDTALSLLSSLADSLQPLPESKIKKIARGDMKREDVEEKTINGIPKNYLFFFKKHKFYGRTI